MNNLDLVLKFADGYRSYSEISLLTGLHRNTVYRICKKHDLPHRKEGGVKGTLVGSKNPAYKGNRQLHKSGYASILAPYDHPNRRSSGYVYEHRMAMEDKIGRYLLPLETVDHIDGLRLHNSPNNLRLFESNAEHLRKTLTGVRKNWSSEGLLSLKLKNLQQSNRKPVNKYREVINSGDFLTIQILRMMLKLESSSPYLLGTKDWLKKRQIFDLSRSNLELQLHNLSVKWELNHSW